MGQSHLFSKHGVQSKVTFILFIYLFNIYLFIWLRQVLVAAREIFVATCGTFSCGM